MPDPKPQSFRNHAAFDPIYHYIASPILLFILITCGILIYRDLRTDVVLSLWVIGLTLLAVLLMVRLRTYPLKIQDRVIRLEERLRLTALVPATLQNRISELSEDQLIALRFASDAEVPSLVELALEKNLTRKQIKERIQTWRPDHFRI